MNRLRSIVLACAVAALPALAIWSPMGQPVPLERVLANVQTQVRIIPTILPRGWSWDVFTVTRFSPQANRFR